MNRVVAVLGGVILAILPAGAAAAGPTPEPPTPSPGAVAVTSAGTSFLTATAVSAGQPVGLTAATGDYLYWAFPASAGQTHLISATVTLPSARSRSGSSTWVIEVFDGLRRRQACTAGAQSSTAAVSQGAVSEAAVSLGCALREVRSWAEPWSGDPLPGTYYVRLSVVDLSESDLGLPMRVDLLVSATDGDDPAPEGGELGVPLVPAGEASGSIARAEEEGEWGWLPEPPRFSTRWFWTGAGGVLAALAGVAGFAMTWRPRRRPS